LAATALLAAETSPVAVVDLPSDGEVDFQRQVLPILVRKCAVCHSGNVTEAELDLSSFKSLMRGGENGAPVVPGKSAESLIIKLAGRTAKPLMPPPDEKDSPPLEPLELALLKRWIDQGAKPPAAGSAMITLSPLSPRVQMVRAVAVAPDKSLVAAGRANAIHVYNAASGQHLRTLHRSEKSAAHQAIVESLTFSPDSRLLASGGFGAIALWDAKTGELVRRWTGFSHRVPTLDFSPDGRWLATGGGAPTEAGEIRVFDAASGEVVWESTSQHSDTVFGVRFSPDGGRLATCSGDMSIKVFQLPQGNLLKTLEGHTHHVLDIAWQADGRLLASAGADRKVRLWEYESGEQHNKIARGGGQISTIFLEHEGEINRLAFVGETTQLFTCSGAHPLSRWTLDMQMRPGNYAKPYLRPVRRELGENTDYLYALSVSPDGDLTASGGRAGVVWLRNGEDGSLLHTLTPPGAAPLPSTSETATP